jgi:hypothetical protein
METTMEIYYKAQDSSETETESEEEARNPFGYQVGNCCSGGLCKLPTAQINPEHKCMVCDKIMHTLCGHEVDDNVASICVVCETK